MRFGRTGAVAVLFVAVTFVSSSTALAQDAPNWADKAGAVGIGGNTTLGGTNGINIRTWVSDLFGIQGTIGFRLTNATAEPQGGGGATDFSSTTFAIGLYVVYKLAYWQRGSLSVLFGGDIGQNRVGISDTTNSDTNVAIALGIQGEYFPTQYLSLFAHTGIRLDFLSDDDAGSFGVDSNLSDISGLDVSLGSDLWGGAGFTVWFN